MTFVVDEYGIIVGVCTLENVLEKFVGPVDDEFDSVSEPLIQKVNDGEFLVLGSALIKDVEKEFGISINKEGIDTVAGIIMDKCKKIPEVGDKVEFNKTTAEVVAVSNDHANKIRFILDDGSVR